MISTVFKILPLRPAESIAGLFIRAVARADETAVAVETGGNWKTWLIFGVESGDRKGLLVLMPEKSGEFCPQKPADAKA